MNAIMIKKTESGFEVSNGTIHVRGPSRDQILAIFDSLEGKPAAVAQIAEKVEKAARVVQKKAAAKKMTRIQKILTVIEKNGSANVDDICAFFGEPDTARRYFIYQLYLLFKARKLKRKKVDGQLIYTAR